MNNVVSLNRERKPNDLLTLNEACRKYIFYNFYKVYKIAQNQ